MTRVFVTAVTPALRAGLRAMLGTADIQVVGEAATLDALTADVLADVDVVVTADDELPNGFAHVITETPPIGLVLLSNHPESAAGLQALPLRGWGIVPPDAPAVQLRSAVAAAAEGLIVLPTPLAARVLGPPANPDEPTPEPLDEPLTAREREVLELLSQGLPNKLIARALNISEHTVKFHVSSIYAKLGVSSRTEAISQGARRGLITL